MSMLSALRRTSRLALLGLALAGSAAFVTPAAADDAESHYSISLDKYYESSRYRVKGYDTYDYCLSDRGVAKAFDDYGFEDVEFVKSVGQWKLLVIAVYDNYYYSAAVDRCTGDIDYVTKLYAWEDAEYEEPQYEPTPRRRPSY